jgi:polyhydroxyalkanoate synthase
LSPTHPRDLLSRIGHELEHVQVRARNGLRHLGGLALGAIGATPKSAAWQRDKVVLYRYESEGRARGVPVLLVMSLITKPYVFDLRPGSSLVEDLLAAGFDVYLLDWGVPEPVDSHNGVDAYVDHYLPQAVLATLTSSGASELRLFGYCLGSLLALLSVAGNPAMPVRSVVLLATPVDLCKMGPLANLLSDGRLSPHDLVDETGNVPASVILDGFRLVQPTAPIATYTNLWKSLASEEGLAAHNALIGWSNDHIPFPGKAFIQLVEGYVRGGAPLRGTAPVGDRIVNLSAIECPVLSVVGARDNLVPPPASEGLDRLLPNTELDCLTLPAGHAGLFVGRTARTRCVPSIVNWLTERA